MVANNIGPYIDVNDEIYLCVERYNAILKVDINKITKYVGIVPNEDMITPFLYWKLVRWNNKIFFIPCSAREIAILDISNLEIRKIHNTNEMKGYESIFCKYSSCYVNGDTLVMIPAFMPMIVEIDMKSEKITHTVNLKKFNNGASLYFAVNDNFVKENMLYSVCWNEPSLIEYNLSRHTVDKTVFPMLKNGFSCMTGYGEKICMLSHNHELIIWNINNRSIEKIERIEELDSLQIDMRRGTVIKDNIIFLDSKLRKIVYYNIIRDKVEVRDGFSVLLNDKNVNYVLYEVEDGNIYAASEGDIYFKYNLKYNSYTYINTLSLSENEKNRYFLELKNIPDNVFMPDMIQQLVNQFNNVSDGEVEHSKNIINTVGRVIYENV